jgi:hypothetical protein
VRPFETFSSNKNSNRNGNKILIKILIKIPIKILRKILDPYLIRSQSLNDEVDDHVGVGVHEGDALLGDRVRKITAKFVLKSQCIIILLMLYLDFASFFLMVCSWIL